MTVKIENWLAPPRQWAITPPASAVAGTPRAARLASDRMEMAAVVGHVEIGGRQSLAAEAVVVDVKAFDAAVVTDALQVDEQCVVLELRPEFVIVRQADDRREL